MSGEDIYYYVLVHKVYKSAELQISTTSHHHLNTTLRMEATHYSGTFVPIYTNLKGVTIPKTGVFSHHLLYLLAIEITWIHTQQDISTSGMNSFTFPKLAQSGKICQDHKWRYQRNKEFKSV